MSGTINFILIEFGIVTITLASRCSFKPKTSKKYTRHLLSNLQLSTKTRSVSKREKFSDYLDLMVLVSLLLSMC